MPIGNWPNSLNRMPTYAQDNTSDNAQDICLGLCRLLRVLGAKHTGWQEGKQQDCNNFLLNLLERVLVMLRAFDFMCKITVQMLTPLLCMQTGRISGRAYHHLPYITYSTYSLVDFSENTGARLCHPMHPLQGWTTQCLPHTCLSAADCLSLSCC